MKINGAVAFVAAAAASLAAGHQHGSTEFVSLGSMKAIGRVGSGDFMNGTGGGMYRELVLDMNTYPINGEAESIYFSHKGAIVSGMRHLDDGQRSLFILPPVDSSNAIVRAHYGGFSMPVEGGAYALLDNDFAIVEMLHPSFLEAPPSLFLFAVDRQTSGAILLGSRARSVYGSVAAVGNETFCWMALFNGTSDTALTCWRAPAPGEDRFPAPLANGTDEQGTNMTELPEDSYVHYSAVQFEDTTGAHRLSPFAPTYGTGSVHGDHRICFAMDGQIELNDGDDDGAVMDVGVELFCLELGPGLLHAMPRVIAPTNTTEGRMLPAIDEDSHPQLIWDASPGSSSGFAGNNELALTGGDSICQTAQPWSNGPKQESAVVACHRVLNLGMDPSNETAMEDPMDGFMVHSLVGWEGYLPASEGFGNDYFSDQGGPAVLGVGRLAYAASSAEGGEGHRDVFVIDQRRNTTVQIEVPVGDGGNSQVHFLQALGTGVVFFNGTSTRGQEGADRMMHWYDSDEEDGFFPGGAFSNRTGEMGAFTSSPTQVDMHGHMLLKACDELHLAQIGAMTPPYYGSWNETGAGHYPEMRPANGTWCGGCEADLGEGSGQTSRVLACVQVQPMAMHDMPNHVNHSDSESMDLLEARAFIAMQAVNETDENGTDTGNTTMVPIEVQGPTGAAPGLHGMEHSLTVYFQRQVSTGEGEGMPMVPQVVLWDGTAHSLHVVEGTFQGQAGGIVAPGVRFGNPPGLAVHTLVLPSRTLVSPVRGQALVMRDAGTASQQAEHFVLSAQTIDSGTLLTPALGLCSMASIRGGEGQSSVPMELMMARSPVCLYGDWSNLSPPAGAPSLSIDGVSSTDLFASAALLFPDTASSEPFDFTGDFGSAQMMQVDNYEQAGVGTQLELQMSSGGGVEVTRHPGRGLFYDAGDPAYALPDLPENPHRAQAGAARVSGETNEHTCAIYREPVNGTWWLDHRLYCEADGTGTTLMHLPYTAGATLRGPLAFASSSSFGKDLGLMFAESLADQQGASTLWVFNTSRGPSNESTGGMPPNPVQTEAGIMLHPSGTRAQSMMPYDQPANHVNTTVPYVQLGQHFIVEGREGVTLVWINKTNIAMDGPPAMHAKTQLVQNVISISDPGPAGQLLPENSFALFQNGSTSFEVLVRGSVGSGKEGLVSFHLYGSPEMATEALPVEPGMEYEAIHSVRALTGIEHSAVFVAHESVEGRVDAYLRYIGQSYGESVRAPGQWAMQTAIHSLSTPTTGLACFGVSYNGDMMPACWKGPGTSVLYMEHSAVSGTMGRFHSLRNFQDDAVAVRAHTQDSGIEWVIIEPSFAPVRPSAPPSASPTPATTASATPSPTPSVTASVSVTPTSSLSPGASPSGSTTPSVTPSISATPSVSGSTSVSPSTSPTPSVSSSEGSVPSNSPTPSVSSSVPPSPSRQGRPSNTPFSTSSPTASTTPTSGLSPTPSNSPPPPSSSPTPSTTPAPLGNPSPPALEPSGQPLPARPARVCIQATNNAAALASLMVAEVRLRMLGIDADTFGCTGVLSVVDFLERSPEVDTDSLTAWVTAVRTRRALGVLGAGSPRQLQIQSADVVLRQLVNTTQQAARLQAVLDRAVSSDAFVSEVRTDLGASGALLAGIAGRPQDGRVGANPEYVEPGLGGDGDDGGGGLSGGAVAGIVIFVILLVIVGGVALHLYCNGKCGGNAKKKATTMQMSYVGQGQSSSAMQATYAGMTSVNNPVGGGGGYVGLQRDVQPGFQAVQMTPMQAAVPSAAAQQMSHLYGNSGSRV